MTAKALRSCPASAGGSVAIVERDHGLSAVMTVRWSASEPEKESERDHGIPSLTPGGVE